VRDDGVLEALINPMPVTYGIVAGGRLAGVG
jgi:hypothetical protein